MLSNTTKGQSEPGVKGVCRIMAVNIKPNNNAVGIDEVGRGCWAGPLLVVAARSSASLPKGLTDSKKLNKAQREAQYDLIVESCDTGEGWVMPAEIDRLGLTKAMVLGVHRALEDLGAETNETLIMDGNVNYCAKKYIKASAVIGADSLFPIVSAASIFAKVTRDRYMDGLPDRYKKYEFSSHVGYGTHLHRKRLEEFGVSDIHRKSFKPVRNLL